MKTKLQLLTVLLSTLVSSEILGQIPNNGFENWTTVGSYMDPNGWATPNSLSTGSFYAVTRAADPYPTSVGNYSVRIENNTSLLANFSGLGIVMTGGLVAPHPAFPITGHPTSLTGYYKFLPQNTDTMYINIIFFLNGTGVASGKLTTTSIAANWTSFNVPMLAYSSADSAHIIIAAYNADGPNNIPYGNSVLFVDNLNFDNLITNGISVVKKINNLSVFPNPLSTQTILQLDDFLNNATLTVYNSFGQTVKEIQNISGQTVTLIRDNLASGLYFIRLKEENKVITADRLVITD